MKNYTILSILALLLGGCASVPKTVTDTVTLYPDNAKAQQWGVIRFYRQYLSTSNNATDNVVTVNLPNGKALKGQLLFLDNGGTAVSDSGFGGLISVGIGHRVGSRGSVGFSLTPRVAHYRSEIEKVSFNAFGEGLGLNCNGDFNRRQRQGILTCQMTNGMSYRGNLQRVVVQ